jgi:hypothetical protein
METVVTGSPQERDNVGLRLEKLDEVATRHPWRSSLVAGVAVGLLCSVLFGVLYGVLAALGHFVIQILGFAWRRRSEGQ